MKKTKTVFQLILMFQTFHLFFAKEKDVPPNETEKIELNDTTFFDVNRIIFFFNNETIF